MAKFIKKEESVRSFTGNLKVATLTDGEKEFEALPEVIKIGSSFYKRCNIKDMTAEQMAYAGSIQ